MLPSTFISESERLPDYICNKCHGTLESAKVEEMMQRIGEDLAEMKKDDVATCKSFIERHSKQLHENHHYNVDVKLALAQIIGQDDSRLPGVDQELLAYKIMLCKKLDRLLEIIVPGETIVVVKQFLFLFFSL